MDKPLAVEYTGKKKWFAYEVFEQLKFDQSERMHILKPQDSQELHSGHFRFDFDEENKEEVKRIQMKMIQLHHLTTVKMR